MFASSRVYSTCELAPAPMFVHGCGSHAPRFGAVRDDLELDGDTATRRQLGHLDGRARRQLFERAEGMIVLSVEGGKVAAHVNQVGLHAGRVEVVYFCSD